MVKCYDYLVAVLLSLVCVINAVPTGTYIASNEGEQQNYNEPYPFAVKRTWTGNTGSYGMTDGSENFAPNTIQGVQSPLHRYSKKSELPEKGQIKFMKSLLGKVKKLLNHTKKHESSSQGTTNTGPEREKKVVASANNGNMYSILGDKEGTKGNEYEKSVNVISIPIDALAKITKTDHPKVEEDNKPVEISASSAGVRGLRPALHSLPEGSESEGGSREVHIPGVSGAGVAQLVPVLLESKGKKTRAMVIVNPQTRTLQPLQSLSTDQDGVPVVSSKPFVPRLVLQRHGTITKSHEADESDNESVYRNIGHIPGQSIARYHSPEGREGLGEATLRHKRPSLARFMAPTRRPHGRAGSVRDNDEYDEDDYDDDDDDYDDDDDEEDGDDDDDDDEEEEDDGGEVSRRDARMYAEAREIAATRNRLYSMLPGNDPMYNYESRGLGLNKMQTGPLPEAFLGNPMLHGMGFGPRTRNSFMGEAMLGEHADNSNDRGAFMLDNRGKRQPFGDMLSSMQGSPSQGGPDDFKLGGSPAETMSPNQVSFLMQKPGAATQFNELSQKNHIFRPHKTTKHKPANVLLKVNGLPIGDSNQLRSHVENGMLVKGKEKVIKSKGPMNVRITKATDGVHSKIVDITSPKTVNVLEAKSKIAKSN